MSKGLNFVPGSATLEILDGARKTFKLGAQMVEFLTDIETFTPTVVFPNFSKDWAYRWIFQNTYDFINARYAKTDSALSFVTVVPQEFDQAIAIDVPPTGADFFAGAMVLVRTGVPASLWQGRTLDVIPKQNVWIPFMGGLSVLMEAEFGVARMMHVYISPITGNLTLRRAQSVSAAPGSYVAFGDTDGHIAADAFGGQWYYGTTPGMPVYQIASGNTAASSLATTTTDGRTLGTTDLPATSSASCFRDRMPGHSAAISVTDPGINFQSTYDVTIVGRYGRVT